MKVGDLVEAVPPFALVCGSGRYGHAVVAQVEPMVLVSEGGDMLWRATVYPGCVRVVGPASQEARETALRRFAGDANRKDW